jgi:hypothetical protein
MCREQPGLNHNQPTAVHTQPHAGYYSTSHTLDHASSAAALHTRLVLSCAPDWAAMHGGPFDSCTNLTDVRFAPSINSSSNKLTLTQFPLAVAAPLSLRLRVPAPLSAGPPLVVGPPWLPAAAATSPHNIYSAEHARIYPATLNKTLKHQRTP